MMGRALAIVLCLAACEIHVAERADDEPSELDPECGNGVVEGSEVCDDGNTAAADGCSAACTSDETCGNGVVDEATEETCDDGNLLGGDGCSNDCKSDETCGNGVIDLAKGETCDDGDLQGGDGCSANCQSNEACGNGIQDPATTPPEECDGGAAGTADCDVNCTTAFCGDGTVNGLRGEQCEDGNGSNNDACVDCRVAFCGDGFVRFGVEQCDGGAGCNGNCQFDPRVYLVSAAGLINQGFSCDGTGLNLYDGCGGLPTGVTWFDDSPFQPSVVQLEFEHGIECIGDHPLGTSLNGNDTGAFQVVGGNCNCDPAQAFAMGVSPVPPTVNTWNVTATGYVRGGQNTLTIAASGSCFGFSGNTFGGNYARITVFP